jgi:hypothetical protein
MMGDEILSPLADPRQVADTELLTLSKREREHQPRRIGERSERLRKSPRRTFVHPSRTQCFGKRKVETEEITGIVSHVLILTGIDTLLVSHPHPPVARHTTAIGSCLCDGAPR